VACPFHLFEVLPPFPEEDPLLDPEEDPLDPLELLEEEPLPLEEEVEEAQPA